MRCAQVLWAPAAWVGRRNDNPSCMHAIANIQQSSPTLQLRRRVQKHGISLAVLERPQEHVLGAALRRAMGRASLPDLLLQQLGCPAIVLPG